MGGEGRVSYGRRKRGNKERTDRKERKGELSTVKKKKVEDENCGKGKNRGCREGWKGKRARMKEKMKIRSMNESRNK